MAEKEEPANSLGVIACILSPDAENHLQWLKTVFDATEKVMHRDETTKKIVHAALRINGGVIYFSDDSCCLEQEEKSAVPIPPGGEARGIMCHLNVEDPFPIWKRAIEGGAKIAVKLETQFWGDLYGTFRDPYGYKWAVCSPTENKNEVEEGGSTRKEP